jgi:flavin reductase (DIM6/NTAB) family NADH-FMN oxidoreductase RutF
LAYSEYVRTHALFVANPAALECKLVLIVQLHGADGTTPSQYLTVGQVVAVELDRAYRKEGLFDLLATHPVRRAGYGAGYTEATTGFKIERPR